MDVSFKASLFSQGEVETEVRRGEASSPRTQHMSEAGDKVTGSGLSGYTLAPQDNVLRGLSVQPWNPSCVPRVLNTLSCGFSATSWEGHYFTLAGREERET